MQNGHLRIVGFDVLSPNICWAPETESSSTRKDMLASWGNRMSGIFNETPLSFVPLSDYEPLDQAAPLMGFQLRDENEIDSKDTGSEEKLTRLPGDGERAALQCCGRTVGQHMGKALPKGTMYI